jgi:sugar lactone lactonase YvrE
LELSGKVLSLSNKNVVATVVETTGQGPDGIDIDERGGHIYWTNMGRVNLDDGSVMRADLDGKNVTTIVPVGGTFTPKQLKIDRANRKLYWSDREGMRVMRANLDGTQLETLVITGSGDADRKEQRRWCVGIAVDAGRGFVYWTQKGGDNANQGTIKRARIEMPKGETAANRSDIEVLFAGLPEPIDLDLDLDARLMYWTDRGDNTVSRAPMEPPKGVDPAKRTDRQVLVSGIDEAIGIALDGKRLFYTSLGGEVGAASIDGTGARVLYKNPKALTGIALLHAAR